MFTVSGGGCNTGHKTPFIFDEPSGLDVHVLLILNHNTHFELSDKNFMAPPYHAILFKKGTPHKYYKKDGIYSDNWIRFECDEEDEKLLDAALPNATLFALKNPEVITNYMNSMLWERFYGDKTKKARLVDTLFRIILEHLGDDYKNNQTITYNPYLSKLQALRIRILSAPYEVYDLEKICLETDISISYFQHIYKKFFSVSFQNDLIKSRIEYAKKLLKNKDITIQEAAFRSGYSNEIHFYRQFKKITGITPNKYRQMNDEIASE